MRPSAVRLGATAHTEASRATWIVGPVLADFWERYAGTITLIAGAEFAADPADEPTGYVDFVVGRASHSSHIQAPLLGIFEAKKDSIPDGFGQCIAGMVGVQRFNRREGTEVDPVWAAVPPGACGSSCGCPEVPSPST